MDLNHILNYVQQYGHVALFCLLAFGIVGLPIPDETVLTFCGYLAFKGHLNLFETYFVAWIGTVSGISVSYCLGRFVGYRVLEKYGWFFHITEEKLVRTEKWFEHGGRWLLTIGYFIPGVRHLFAIAAGSTCVRYPVFAFFAYMGGLIWTATFITLGYMFGDTWEKVAKQGQHIGIYLAIGIAATIIAGFFITHRVLRKKYR